LTHLPAVYAIAALGGQPAGDNRGQSGRLLTAAVFQSLADVPPEIEWFGNRGNQATRRAYETALKDFTRFSGIERREEFRITTRAHVIAWREELARRQL
jgi:integrase/recombinase XerD